MAGFFYQKLTVKINPEINRKMTLILEHNIEGQVSKQTIFYNGISSYLVENVLQSINE